MTEERFSFELGGGDKLSPEQEEALRSFLDSAHPLLKDTELEGFEFHAHFLNPGEMTKSGATTLTKELAPGYQFAGLAPKQGDPQFNQTVAYFVRRVLSGRQRVLALVGQALDLAFFEEFTRVAMVAANDRVAAMLALPEVVKVEEEVKTEEGANLVSMLSEVLKPARPNAPLDESGGVTAMDPNDMAILDRELGRGND